MVEEIRCYDNGVGAFLSWLVCEDHGTESDIMTTMNTDSVVWTTQHENVSCLSSIAIITIELDSPKVHTRWSHHPSLLSYPVLAAVAQSTPPNVTRGCGMRTVFVNTQ